jgi:hypothetical protein
MGKVVLVLVIAAGVAWWLSQQRSTVALKPMPITKEGTGPGFAGGNRPGPIGGCGRPTGVAA